jgi:uncharacterized repeat protein (TIGR01451 family)
VITTPPPPVVTTTPLPPPPTVGMPQGNLQAPPVYPDAGVPASPPPVITTPPATAPPISAPLTAIPPATAAIVPVPPPPPPIDAQFAFPAPTIAQAGHPLVLTTLVTRRTDRAPLVGWTVRYEVSSSGAALGGTGGNRVEVPTDSSGRASIEISPLSTAPGEAVVNILAIAPPELTSGSTPAAEVARGTATISWRQGVPGAPAWAPQPLAMSGDMPAPSLEGPPLPAPPTTDSAAPSLPYSNDRAPSRFEPPPSPSASDRYGPPPTYSSSPTDSRSSTAPPPPREQSTAGRPELAVEVRLRGSAQVEVGGFANFDVIITNRGTATARNVKLLDTFDEGLTHIRAQSGERAVKYEDIKELAAGDSQSVALTFGVRAAGQLCHQVNVSADGVSPVIERGCVTAINPRPTGQPTIEVTKQGPRRHYVGEMALFSVIVKNTGNEPVTNLVINDRYDPALEPRETGAGAKRLADDSFEWRIPLLTPGEKRDFKVSAACVSPSSSACSRATVTADGGIIHEPVACVEILPGASATAPGGVGPAPALPAQPLKITLQSTQNPARVGVPAALYVFVENVGRDPQRQVTLRVQLPVETQPLANQVNPPGQMVGAQELRFIVGDVGPGERKQFEIPFNPVAARVVTFNALVEAAGLTQPISMESTPIQIEAAAQ